MSEEVSIKDQSKWFLEEHWPNPPQLPVLKDLGVVAYNLHGGTGDTQTLKELIEFASNRKDNKTWGVIAAQDPPDNIDKRSKGGYNLWCAEWYGPLKLILRTA